MHHYHFSNNWAKWRCKAKYPCWKTMLWHHQEGQENPLNGILVEIGIIDSVFAILT